MQGQTYVGDGVPAVRLGKQSILVLRLGVLPGHLGAFEAAGTPYGRKGPPLLHPEAPRTLDLQQPGAPDTNLPDRHWGREDGRGEEKREGEWRRRERREGRRSEEGSGEEGRKGERREDRRRGEKGRGEDGDGEK